MITFNFFAPFLIAWFIAHFEPGQQVIDWVYKYIPEKLQSTRQYLGCFKCLSFWITLCYTFNPLIAIAFSMLAYTYTRIMSSLKMYL